MAATEALVLRPERLGDDPDGVATALTDAFAAARAAVEAGRPVTFVVDGADLLGQGGLADAAVATGLLGLMRTLAIEGAKPGWRANMVAVRAGGEEAGEAAVELLAGSELSGQLLQPGTSQLGKVVP